MPNEDKQQVVPAEGNPAMKEAIKAALEKRQPQERKQLSHLRIATADVIKNKLGPIQSVEHLLGIKSATMAAASDIVALFDKVDAIVDRTASWGTGQRINAWMDIMQENTREHMAAAFTSVAKSYEGKEKDSGYTRNSERKAVFNLFVAGGRKAVEKAVNGHGYTAALTGIREALKPLVAAKREHSKRIELMAEYLPFNPAATDEQRAQGLAKVEQELTKAKEAAAQATADAAEEAKTPKGVARRTATRLVGADGEAFALKVAALLAGEIKTYAAEVRAADKAKADKAKTKKAA